MHALSAWFVVAVSLAQSNTALNMPLSAEDPAKKALPGLAYGTVTDLPLPKTILFSATPDQIAADAETWAQHGVTAFFMDGVAREWSSDIWATDNKPWTIGESDETFQKAKAANEVCRRIGSETFLKVAFDHFFEWFNDTAWQKIDDDFRQFAIFARDSGCNGIALDIEYCGEQYHFEWKGYTYNGYSREQLIRKVRERMTRLISILYDEFPNMTFLTFPEGGLGFGTAIHTAWIEEAARRNAHGGVHYCTEFTYRNPNINYMFGHAWACNDTFQRLLSPRGQEYWRTKCSIAAGVWPFGFDYQVAYEPGMPLEELRQAYAASLMMSSKYNWIYSHNCYQQLAGRELDKYNGKEDLPAYLHVFVERQVVTTPKYLDLAKELRSLRLRDYSDDLGVRPFVGFAGPDDIPAVRLMPKEFCDTRELDMAWELATEYFVGKDVNISGQFHTQPHWMIIGPFPSPSTETALLQGHNAVYPPEQSIDLRAEYDGLEGKVRWNEYREDDRRVSVDLNKAFGPNERVCAYALCYVTSPDARDVQIRVGTNDSGKLWLGGKLVYDYPSEGTAFLDRDIVPVHLPAGTTPILLKVCNNQRFWGFVFRITDAKGRPIPELTYTLQPPK